MKITFTHIKDIALTLLMLFFVLRSCGDVKNDLVPSGLSKKDKKEIINAIKDKRLDIVDSEKVIHTYEKEVYNKREVENMLSVFKDSLFSELASAKIDNSLGSVIRIQDSIINIQELELSNYRGIIDYKDSIIFEKDSIIYAQRYIINSQDTLLAVSNADVKKFRRQRNVLAIVALIEAGVLIFK